MMIHSLSGPSGSGKSTSALQFAHEQGIEAIIDDGILVIKGERVAGTSAKYERNTIKAIRRAIFEDEEHKKEVQEAIKEYDVQSILIIGTSDKMTKKIAQKLELGDINSFHYIEEIRSNKDIQIAKFVRGTQGMHVMPIPYKQVEQNIFKRMIHRGFEIFSKNKEKLGETTIVRPVFHQQTIDISQKVYVDLLEYILENYKGIAKVDSFHFTLKQLIPSIYIVIYIPYPVDYFVVGKIEELQQYISHQFLKHFEFQPGEIHVYVKGVSVVYAL